MMVGGGVGDGEGDYGGGGGGLIGGGGGGLLLSSDIERARQVRTLRRALCGRCEPLMAARADAESFPNLWLTSSEDEGERDEGGREGQREGERASERAGERESGSEGERHASTPLLYDRILCDVPCSGDGTLRKSPSKLVQWNVRAGLRAHGLQAKLHAPCFFRPIFPHPISSFQLTHPMLPHPILSDAFSPPAFSPFIQKTKSHAEPPISKESLVSFKKKQLSILSRALALLRPGGRLVYSTCALDPLQGEAVVAAALAADASLNLLPPERALPSETAARLKWAPGLSEWLVPHPEFEENKTMYKEWEQVTPPNPLQPPKPLCSESTLYKSQYI